MSEVKKIEDVATTARQEIKALIKLRENPNIITIEDVIEDNEKGRYYLVL